MTRSARRTANWSALARHVVGTLPGDIALRRALLSALLEEMPAGHVLEDHVRSLAHSLNEHILAQREFPFSDQGQGGAS